MPSGAADGLKSIPRTDKEFPLYRSLPDGGLELVVGYMANLSAGNAKLFARLRFDQNGNFLAATAQNVMRKNFLGGPHANRSLHYKVGDFFQVLYGVFDGDSASVAPGNSAVAREVGHEWAGTMCSSPCVLNYIWTFEAVGRGETNLVFNTIHGSQTWGEVLQPSRVHVD